MAWWTPETYAEKIPLLRARAEITARIRAFFAAREYLEVETPALQKSPCMEAHVRAIRAGDFYLHTSPEFAMKKLLVAGLPAIFQLCHAFRDEAPSRWHSPEFTMLEWYRAGLSYENMMQETIDLCRTAAPGTWRANGHEADPSLPWEILTVRDAVLKHAGIDIKGREGDIAHLKTSGVHISPHDDWDNALLKILMDKVEPNIGSPAPTILCDYPASMAALARLKPSNPAVAERFEVYACGVELCNAFGELTDPAAQRARFEKENKIRQAAYGETYPVDEDFIKALEQGLPPSSGNALGLDRLVMLATGAGDIRLVQAAPFL